METLFEATIIERWQYAEKGYANTCVRNAVGRLEYMQLYTRNDGIISQDRIETFHQDFRSPFSTNARGATGDWAASSPL